MALTLTFGRIATALNYNLSPWLDEHFSEDWVCWFGFGLCLLSAGATVITMILDSPQSRAKAGLVESDAPCTKKQIMNDSGIPDNMLLDDDSDSIFSEDEHMNLAHLPKFSPSFWLLNIILLALYGMYDILPLSLTRP
jgi:hypothetical protein